MMGHSVQETFSNDIKTVLERYNSSGNLENLQKDLQMFKKYSEHQWVGDLLIYIGEGYITAGDYPAGISFMKTVDAYFKHIANTTNLYLRMAEYCIQNGQTDKGTEYLIALCKRVSNYEESIAFNELTDVWDKYKHLVEGKVEPSISVNSKKKPLPPEKCSMQIEEIFALPEDDILLHLSDHLNEMSANGDWLNSLNKWEKMVYYADELCMEVNSGGFNSYLYYYGAHFEKALQVFEEIEAHEMVSLLERVARKFPRGKVPKSLDSIQNAMDKLEEKGIDFEAEDSTYYTTAEKDLLNQLLVFVLQNKKHFR